MCNASNIHGPRRADHCNGCPALKMYRNAFGGKLVEVGYCMLEPEPRMSLRRAPNVDWRCRHYRCKAGDWRERLKRGEHAKMYA